MKVSPAFTLIELLVVIALLGFITISGASVITSAKANQEIRVSSDKLTDTLRRAHIFSRDGKDEKQWGVHSDGGKSYQLLSRVATDAAPLVVSDIPLPSSVTISSPFTVWFFQGTGETGTKTVIHLNTASSLNMTISVEKTGVIDTYAAE
jgi:prepilin-type N-terminal cleavage/methylation domain-containing protein